LVKEFFHIEKYFGLNFPQLTCHPL